MAFAVSKLQGIGREIANPSHFQPRSVAPSSRDTSQDRQKFGALVPAQAPRRDDRVNAFDYSNAPFVTQLIASRDADSPSHLHRRLQSDVTARAYEAAEALPERLPIGLYLEQSI